MPVLSRRHLVQAAGLAPLVLPTHHRPGHGGPKPAEPTPTPTPAPAPAPVDPGPPGDLAWSGVNWLRRTWPGAPHYNGLWSPDNVVDHGDGTLTLRLTNPGGAPVAAELLSTRLGWGYGTYQLDYRADLDTVSPSVVWGSMFTYDSTQAWNASHNEVDAGEISAWGVPGIAQRVTAGYWVPGPAKVDTHNVPLPRGLRVYRSTMTWTPGFVSFATYAGATAPDTLVAASQASSPGVPVPALERVHVNLWVTDANADDETLATPCEVRLTGFAFTPA